MDNFNNLNNLVNLIESKYNPRSAWHKGVKKYALELAKSLVENYSNEDIKHLKKALLNGAKNWQQYSYGGCSLICDTDIAERCCTKSELKRTKNGEKQPNKYITWLDVQTKALSQALSLVTKILSEV